MEKIFSKEEIAMFKKFINKIYKNDKVALVTHNDLDGIVCAKVVEKVIKCNLLRFIDYPEIRAPFVKELKKHKINKVIFTDINITDKKILKEIEKFAEILIIDHHVSEDWNSQKTIFLNKHHYCAAYLSYILFSEFVNLEQLDWLVACACLTDWAYSYNREFMKEVYEKYGDKFIIKNELVKKQGRMYETAIILSSSLIYFYENIEKCYGLITDSINDVRKLKKYRNIIQKEIDRAVTNFNNEKKMYGKDVYFWKFNPNYPIKAIVSTLVSSQEHNKTFIFVRPNRRYINISARRQDKKISMVDLMKKLTQGLEDSNCGGHVPAAGGNILKKDFKKFKKRIEEL
ncbi:MAG: DHHA1 domain-containing protein [Candidatus Pacearchaeota archaeon]